MIDIMNAVLGRYKTHLFNSLKIVSIIKKYPTVSIEPNVFIKGNLDNLILGESVVIQSGTVIHLGGMEWCQWKGLLKIGDNSVISPNCVIYAAGPGGVRLGRNFDCGPSVGIFASRTDYQTSPHSHIFQPVEIGDNVTIFANSVVSPGVKISEDSVIAAGSVVTQDVPRNVLVGGVPARVIRENVKETYVRGH